MRNFIIPLLMLLAINVSAETTQFRIIDNSYTLCDSKERYQQLLRWSLYGVGNPPESGCFPAPANAKAIIKQCPENDIMICHFHITPEDGSPAFEAWASKVMLRPEK
ncbi:MAG: hypothetical protein ACRBB6_08535 [Neptuniibacter sp.]